jgi:hypothetical protein
MLSFHLMVQKYPYSDLSELNYSKQRRVKNEQLFYDMNKRIQETAKELVMQSKTEKEDLTLKFACECSDASCIQKIELDVAAFEKIHNIDDQYVVIPTHEQLDIENIIKTFPDYSVVKKFYKIEE